MFALFMSKTYSCLNEFELELKIGRERRERVDQGLEIERKKKKRNIFGILQLMSNKEGKKDKQNIHFNDG